MKRFIHFVMLLIGISLADQVYSQDRTVTGTVIADQTQQPIPDVSVSLRGSAGGTVTDAEGKFSLGVPAGITELEFSHGNYSSRVVPIESGAMTIVMTLGSQQLNEVVVVGYGTVKRTAVTGAVSTANLKAFRESPNVSLLGSLRGTVPGLNVGASASAGREPKFSIRGVNSISGNQSPLIVLDGIIYRGTINEINPNDIESINVLKDASSAAVYGAQAANGVILITSKKGRRGDKPTISYTGKYVIREAANVPAYYNAEEYVQLFRDWDWINSRLGPDYTTPNPDNNILQYMFEPEKLNWEQKRFTDWWDVISQQGRMYESDISVSGANDRTSYYISGSFSDQRDVIINDNYKRVSTRINLENKVTDWLRIGTQTFLSNNDYSGAEPQVYLGYNHPPLAYPYYDDGTLIPIPTGFYFGNPLIPIEVDDFNKNLQINTTNYAIVNLPVKGLTYRANYGNRFATERMYYFDPNFSNRLGRGEKRNMFYHDWTLDNILNYDRQFGDHNLGVTLLYGREERSAEGATARGEGFTNQTLGYHSLESASTRFAFSESWQESSLYQMGRLNYSYKDKYYAGFIIRRDGFSGFGENKKFGTFPSVSVGYVLSETALFSDNIPAISYLKLRGSYGSSGNRTVGRYQTLAAVTTRPGYVFSDGGTVVNSQFVASLANANLGWETTTGVNLGLDFEVLNGRFRGSVEYFNTDTRDLLYNITIPSMTGFSSVATNIGKMHNTGFEFDITSTNVQTKQFVWRTSVVFSTVKNKVVSILGLDLDEDGREDDLVSSLLFIGKPLGTIYDHRIVGMYQIGDDVPSGYKPGYYRLEDRDKDNDVDPNDRDFLGYAEPAYRVSMLNELEFKGLTLRVFINSIQGGKNGYYGNNSPHQDGDNIVPPNKNAPKEWNYWTPENPNAEYPALNYLPPIGGNVYRQRNFVRLQDVTLSYRVNAPFVSKLKIADLRIFVNGQNLHTWSKWKGWDPETGAGLRGTFGNTDDTAGRPLIKSYTFGLNISL